MNTQIPASARTRPTDTASARTRPTDTVERTRPATPDTSRPLRLLTTLRHERYSCALAAIGHRWDVIAGDALCREPWRAARLLPANARAIAAATAQQRLERGDYDAVVCHELDDLDRLSHTSTATVLVLHTTRQGDRLLGLMPSAHRRRLAAAIARAQCVFTGPDVQQSWALDGRVIPPAADDRAVDYRGDIAAALRVDTGDRERAWLTAGTPLEEVLRGLPCTAVTAGADWRELCASHRVFVAAPRAPWQTGAPLPMLDAMAAGMPVVTTAHPASPIVHDVSGLVAQTAGELRGHVLDLLGDPARAHALGRCARAHALDVYGIGRFTASWRDVLAATIDARRGGLAVGGHEASCSAVAV